jgi:hypothetical protein
VTGLGAMSPFGRLSTLNNFLKMTQVAQILVLLVSTISFLRQILQNKDWASLWAIFCHKHLVTLIGYKTCDAVVTNEQRTNNVSILSQIHDRQFH